MMQKRGGAIEGARIFVVEDESLITMLVQDSFEKLRCDVVSLASGFEDALDKLAASGLTAPTAAVIFACSVAI